MKKKNPEVATLDSYSKDPGPKFWKVFPFKDLPKEAKTKVNGTSVPKIKNINVPSW